MYYKVTNEELFLKANDFWGGDLVKILMIVLTAAIAQFLARDHTTHKAV